MKRFKEPTHKIVVQMSARADGVIHQSRSVTTYPDTPELEVAMNEILAKLNTAGIPTMKPVGLTKSETRVSITVRDQDGSMTITAYHTNISKISKILFDEPAKD